MTGRLTELNTQQKLLVAEALVCELSAALKRVQALRDLWATQGHHAQWRAEVLTAAINGTPSKWRPE